ncbi:MAG: helix-turn-helix domain-containing protein [Burkholderiaceae bacterium]
MLIRPGAALFYGASPRPKRLAINLIRFVIPHAQFLSHLRNETFECNGRLVQVRHPFIVPADHVLLPTAHEDHLIALLIERHTQLGQWLTQRYPQLSEVVCDPAPFYAILQSSMTKRDMRAMIELVCRAVEFPWASELALSRYATNPQIQLLLETLDQRDPLPSLREAADELGLSYSRASRLFAHSVGLSYARYVLQLRFYRAVAKMEGRQSFTETAYESGFSDLAHLSRTVRGAFGLRLVELLSGLKVTTALH